MAEILFQFLSSQQNDRTSPFSEIQMFIEKWMWACLTPENINFVTLWLNKCGCPSTDRATTLYQPSQSGLERCCASEKVLNTFEGPPSFCKQHMLDLNQKDMTTSINHNISVGSFLVIYFTFLKWLLHGDSVAPLENWNICWSEPTQLGQYTYWFLRSGSHFNIRLFSRNTHAHNTRGNV